MCIFAAILSFMRYFFKAFTKYSQNFAEFPFFFFLLIALSEKFPTFASLYSKEKHIIRK